MSDYSTTLEAPFTEDEVDTLLTGGEEAVQLMQNIRKRDIAYAVMQARKAGKVARRLGLTIEDQIREAVRIVSEIYGISEAEAGSQMGVKPQG